MLFLFLSFSFLLSSCFKLSPITLSIYLSIFQYYLYLSHSTCLSLSLFLCPIALSITCSYLFLFISFAFSLTLSLSFSSFLLMSASFLPSSNILSFMYRVLSKLCKCVDCKSMLKLSSSLSVMFSSYFYLKLIYDSFYLIYFVSTNLSLPPNIFFLLHSSES